ncbi:YdhK family protein [Bacillus sp. ISL-51]|uniref:YdhK family protein n=1 Tax=Bacteria TaxID=2 RepID=UPI001BE6E830|nr:MULTISPECIES: YdhK family protein [Bacteria]MBT2573081.1 YdhK family protein [Bacillus sp. ISL-51]MBT2634985.1 YdhK family protein [Bacillus sp. ISL-26]MBT2712100.1 YdhK family protein [Pseudomonas sp. ISL-88]
MKAKSFLFSMFLLIPVLVLGGCNSQSSGSSKKGQDKDMHSHEDMNHSGTSEVPKGLKEAKNPTYKAGSDVMILASHMKGMKNAQGTVTGAYDTTVYSVSYTPTTGGKRVENHKWVIQEELKGAGDKTLKPGDKAALEASHMKGMKGAEAVIDSAKKTTVYMVDYTPTTGGKKVTNHKWVTEDELTAAK